MTLFLLHLSFDLNRSELGGVGQVHGAGNSLAHHASIGSDVQPCARDVPHAWAPDNSLNGNMGASQIRLL